MSDHESLFRKRVGSYKEVILMLQCNTPEELAKTVEDLHGQTEILFRGKLVTLIAADDDLDE